MTDQLYRYEELVALYLADSGRLKARLAEQKQVILALDGLQPDVGHEVLWVLRDCCSGEVLVARSLLGATENDLVPLLPRVAQRAVSSEPIVSTGRFTTIASGLPTSWMWFRDGTRFTYDDRYCAFMTLPSLYLHQRGRLRCASVQVT